MDPVERVALSDEERALFERSAGGDRVARNLLVERYMGLATHISKRFAGRGRAEDVRQAAMIGLIKAVDRFDPDLGFPFSAFAGSTIEGELKRFLRDASWVVRVPRSAKELHLAIRRASEELTQRLGRSPTVAELAAHLRVDQDEVIRGLAAGAAYEVGSLDAPVGGPDGPPPAVADHERGYGDVLDASVVTRLMDKLPAREREIVRQRFFEERSQSEIAASLGISQMHVSRLLRKSFELMRTWLPSTS